MFEIALYKDPCIVLSHKKVPKAIEALRMRLLEGNYDSHF
jgi:hypothetical protein